jgi:hypothetical protein
MESEGAVVPEVIRLMDATGKVVLDSLSSDYEDSFCLETFGDLIRAAEDKQDSERFETYQLGSHLCRSGTFHHCPCSNLGS